MKRGKENKGASLWLWCAICLLFLSFALSSCQTEEREELEISTEQIDFSGVAVGQSITRSILLSTRHQGGITILSLFGASEETNPFSIEKKPLLPFQLLPEESQRITIRYTPRSPCERGVTLSLFYRVAPPRAKERRIRLETNADTLPHCQRNPYTSSLCDYTITPTPEEGLLFIFPNEINREITLTHRGHLPQFMNLPTFEGGSGAFSLVSYPTASVMHPGETWRFVVHYDPSIQGKPEDAFLLRLGTQRIRIPLRVVERVSRPAVCSWFPVPQQEIDFAFVAPTQKRRKTISLYNIGQEACEMSSLEAQILDRAGQQSAIFQLAPLPTEKSTYSSGQEMRLSVDFSPNREGQEEARLRVQTKEGQRLEIALRGQGEEPCLRLPEALAIQHPKTNCQKEDTPLVLEHTGARGCPAQITITEMEIQQAERWAFSLEPSPRLPLLVRQGEPQTVFLRQNAAFPAPRHAWLSLTYERETGSLRKIDTLLQENMVDRQRKETFFYDFPSEWENKRHLDALFVIHPSVLMGGRRQQVLENIKNLAEWFKKIYDVTQVGVITTDATEGRGKAGCMRQGAGAHRAIVRSTDAFFVSQVVANADISSSSPSQGQGLKAAQLALSSEALAPSGCNAGFLRQDAFLWLFFLSDTDDSSSGVMAEYADFFKKLHSFREYTVRAFSLGGAFFSGCRDSFGAVQPTPRYIEIAHRLNNFSFMSVCDPKWSYDLTSLMPRLSHFERRFLTGKPLPSTLRVIRNGKELSSEQWFYDWRLNAVTRSSSFSW